MIVGIFDFLKKIFKTDATEKKKVQVNHEEVEQSEETSDFHKSFIADIHPVYKRKLPNGLLPGEIILLDWINGKKKTEAFPGYFDYQYGIDARASLKKLMEHGYLEYATPEDSLVSLKVPELKEILKTKDLKVSGKKAELIERIKEHFSPDEISEYVKQPTIKLTAKGNKSLLNMIISYLPINLIRKTAFIMSQPQSNLLDG